MRLIVPVAHVVHPNTFVGIRGMDKLAAADINADVGDAVLIGIFEENQVARLEQAIRDLFAVVVLLGRRAREGNSVSGTENIANEAGTVKAGTRCAAHDIAGAAKRIRGSDDVPAMNSGGLCLNLCNMGFVIRPGMRLADMCREECRCAGGECRE